MWGKGVWRWGEREIIYILIAALSPLSHTQKHTQLVSSLNGHSKKTWCLTSTETVRFIRDGEKGMEMEGEGDYIPIATLSPPE